MLGCWGELTKGLNPRPFLIVESEESRSAKQKIRERHAAWIRSHDGKKKLAAQTKQKNKTTKI